MKVKIPELDVSEHELMDDDTALEKTAEERREEKLEKKEGKTCLKVTHLIFHSLEIEYIININNR